MLKHRGQHLAELALCLAVVTAVFMGMQLYVKRSLQARLKAGADYIFHDLAQEPLQYDPYYATSNLTTTQGADTAVPASWNREIALPSVEEKFSNESGGGERLDAVSGRSGWQRVGSAQDTD